MMHATCHSFHDARPRRYSALFFWDTLYKESVVAGKFLAGRLLVLDLSGISLAKGMRASDFVSKQMSAWPAKAPERIPIRSHIARLSSR